jgi:threonine dehydrogenase-like Zn-dependent dehydrogenase
LIPSEKPHPLTHETLPLTIGHEFSGTIEEIGDDVTRLKVGDRVCVQPTIYDGDCLSCRRGLVNCCDQNGFIGLSGWGGGMSEHIVVPQDSVKKLPDNVSLEIGALVEPLSVGWHAVSISPYKKGDCVLVLGGGPIGLAVVQVLRAQECDTIIVSEISSRRMQYAKEFGAHHVVDPSKGDLVAEVKRLTHGAGVDLAFDAAGVQVGLDSALCSIKARGMLVNIAIWEKRATLNMNDVVFRERAYMGTATFALGDFEQVIDAISSGGTFVQTMGRNFANEHRKIDAGRNDYEKDQDERD